MKRRVFTFLYTDRIDWGEKKKEKMRGTGSEVIVGRLRKRFWGDRIVKVMINCGTSWLLEH